MGKQIKCDLTHIKVNESVYSQLPDFTYCLCVRKSVDRWTVFRVKGMVVYQEIEVDDPTSYISPVIHIFDENTTKDMVEEWRENYVHYFHYGAFIERLVHNMFPY